MSPFSAPEFVSGPRFPFTYVQIPGTQLCAMGSPSWLHVSDLHSGNDAFGAAYLGDHLLAFLRQKKTRDGFVPALVFFSGDIANKGQSGEYNLFNERLLYPLLELYGDGILNGLIFVPGNHDVDRSSNPLIDTYGLCDRYPTLFDCTQASAATRRGLVDRFAAFGAALPSSADSAALFGEQGYFVRILSFPTASVGVVGINTAWLCQSDHDKRQLNPGKYGLTKGLAAIASCNLRIVIGHHPTSWFRDGEREAIEALLAQNNVIYLHGHLHETATEYVNRGGHEYLALQAGAVFESRDARERPNTILLGCFDVIANQAIVEPYSWNPRANEWSLSTRGMPEDLRVPGEARWRFPLPTSKTAKVVSISKKSSLGLPAGWVEITRSNLERWSSAEQTSDQMLSYFDGRPPRWTDAASLHVPHRKVVAGLVNDALAELSEPGASLILITGAGGEGKSTVLRQICCALLRRCPELRILFRNDDERGLPSEYVLNDLPTETPWLVVADEASNLVSDVFFQQQVLSQNKAHRIAYLLAARDTDWIGAKGRAFNWASVTRYKEALLRGICIDDARAIVTAWGQYGRPGLQKLNGYPADQAAHMLVAASMHEEQSSDGAFLGAMLTVRYGAELRNHIDTILSRLKTMPAVCGYTLLEAFAAIVALDKLHVPILTKEILARYLGCKDSEVRRCVMAPLGDEALLTVAGGYLLSRHRAIAAVAYELLEANHDVSFVDVYKGLVVSAMGLISEGKYVAHVPRWRYLSRTLFEAGERSMAIEVAKTVVSLHPDNSYFVVHLAALHRESGRNDLALTAFRTSRIEATDNRGFFTEWAAVERRDKNFYAAVWLTTLAISDGQSSRGVSNDDVKMAFSELCICGRDIFVTYNDDSFLALAQCCQNLALMLPISAEERQTFEGALGEFGQGTNRRASIQDSQKIILQAADTARSRCGPEFTFLPTAQRGLSLGSLGHLLFSASRLSPGGAKGVTS